MKDLQSLDWVNDSINKLRQGYQSKRASIAHYSASNVAIEDVEFSSGIGLKFTQNYLVRTLIFCTFMEVVGS